MVAKQLRKEPGYLMAAGASPYFQLLNQEIDPRALYWRLKGEENRYLLSGDAKSLAQNIQQQKNPLYLTWRNGKQVAKMYGKRLQIYRYPFQTQEWRFLKDCLQLLEAARAEKKAQIAVYINTTVNKTSGRCMGG